ncbi:MAG TPA: hypothetical protein VE987_06830 [Polyangiaceae bacterium]|nr:hypothetical protein [Polyangiaceae bacterium]
MPLLDQLGHRADRETGRAVALEELREQAPQVLVVVEDHDPARHAVSRKSSVRGFELQNGDRPESTARTRIRCRAWSSGAVPAYRLPGGSAAPASPREGRHANRNSTFVRSISAFRAIGDDASVMVEAHSAERRRNVYAPLAGSLRLQLTFM